MDRYKYSIELRYIKQKENVSQQIDSKYIKSVIIDRDYINNNLPVIFMNVILDKKLIDNMIKNQDKNTMVLTIYKYIYKENKLATKTRYIHNEMMYFIQEDLNYRSSLDFSEKENVEREDKFRRLRCGCWSSCLLVASSCLYPQESQCSNRSWVDA